MNQDNTPSGPERSVEEMTSMQWIIAADRNPESEDTRWMEFDGVKTSGRFFKERGEGDDHFYYLDNGPIVRTNKFHLLKWLDESAPLLSTQQGERMFTLQDLKDVYNAGHSDGIDDASSIERGESADCDPVKYFKEKFNIDI